MLGVRKSARCARDAFKVLRKEFEGIAAQLLNQSIFKQTTITREITQQLN